MEYRKIDTLYVRDERTHKVIPDQIRRAEFLLPKWWMLTEKINGTNIRVAYGSKDAQPAFMGRTDDAMIPPFLYRYLQETITTEGIMAAFTEPETEDFVPQYVVLYGEGYGARIQKGGGDYCDGVSFRLFDVLVGTRPHEGGPGQEWWLGWKDVEDVARKLGIKTVPVLAENIPLHDVTRLVTGPSSVALEEKGQAGAREREGIVARTEPLLFDRRGERVVWKLKGKDFA